MRRLYLSGTITSDPDHGQRFAEAEQRLTRWGYDVVNPARDEIPDADWLDYMRRGVTDLMTCEGVALLPGWERGRGSRIEANLAWSLGIPARTLDEWM